LTYVTNMRGRQVHSGVRPANVNGRHLLFVDGAICDVDSGCCFGSEGITVVDPGDEGFISSETPGVTIINVRETHGATIIETGGATVVQGRAGQLSVNLGRVDPTSGIQIGSGNTQINHF
jgi:hypothetical protein